MERLRHAALVRPQDDGGEHRRERERAQDPDIERRGDAEYGKNVG